MYVMYMMANADIQHFSNWNFFESGVDQMN